jgi:glycosyltransferase involved in cell wall biosynthesis
VSVITQYLLASSLNDHYRLLHLDTTDRRSMANSEHFDLVNVYLALVHVIRYLAMLARHRPNIVYVPIAQTALGFLRDSLFLIPARWFGARLVVHLHGGSFDAFYAGSNVFLRMLVRGSLCRVDLAVVLNEKFRTIFGDIISPERVVVVENGVPDDFCGASLLPRARPGKYQVLFLGTLVKSKGFLDVLHAAPVVLEQIREVEFVFAGDGSGFREFEEARAWVRDRKLLRQVRFVGPKWGEEKRRLLLESDVLVFASWAAEGQPLVILEAMAAGVPILTTRHAAIEQALSEDGAVYIAGHDPGQIGAQLIELLQDPERRLSLGRESRRRFLSRYTVEQFADNLRRALARVVLFSERTPAEEAKPLSMM